MKVHYFNPENDLALATNLANYTAPKAAQQLHDAGAILPLWYADADDQVMCGGINADWLDEMRQTFGIGADVFAHRTDIDGIKPAPWGWSLAARQDFIDNGFDASRLPTPSEIETMRQLSHRRTALQINTMLRERLPFAINGDGVEVKTLQEVQLAIAARGNCFVKAPWSSSGRGVAETDKIGLERALKIADDCIRRQGSAIIEKAYDKTADFALLFQCASGSCQYVGLSMFATDQNGAYSGNILAPESKLREKLSSYCSISQIDTLIAELQSILSEIIAPYYSGILGIDMIACSDGSIDPTVELNLRHTMGYVAHRFSELHLAPGAEGTFTVRRGTLADVTNFRTLEIVDKKIKRGSLFLTPPDDHFAFEVIVRDSQP